MTSSASGGLPLTIAGSISASGGSVSGAVHVEGSNCLDRSTTVALTGALTGNSISLILTSADGQVITTTGSVSEKSLAGTYTINGGCADGDQGRITGIKVPTIGGTIDGIFTTSGNESFNGGADLTQVSAGSEGSFGLAGTFSFSTPCFSSGMIKSGTFPSAASLWVLRWLLKLIPATAPSRSWGR